MDTFLGIEYNTLWFIVLVLIFTGYAILDGYDFGVGIVHAFLKTDEHRMLAIQSVGPLWDGNKVWLVIGGGSLFAGFPLLYASLFSALYIPFMLFLFFFIMRAISIEFRSKEDSASWRKWWDIAYITSNVALPVLLAVVLANVMLGLPIDSAYNYTGGALFEFLSLYPILVGLLALAIIIWHGGLFLIIKSPDDMNTQISKVIKVAFIGFIALLLVVTFYGFSALPQHVTARISSSWLIIFPISTFILSGMGYWFIQKKSYRVAFVLSSVIIALLLSIAAIGIFPYLLYSTTNELYSITVSNAASSVTTLKIMLTLTAIGLPLLIAYTIIALRVFRGKTSLQYESY